MVVQKLKMTFCCQSYEQITVRVGGMNRKASKYKFGYIFLLFFLLVGGGNHVLLQTAFWDRIYDLLLDKNTHTTMSNSAIHNYSKE